ncbi:RidA family protein [Myroides sp. M-43]|uniref:RidA family protein n=1 Tax=Myroides oncorhynchi TaxID=2893756 RepID=UPI001E2A396E|nr:RidA family protein [Myroides oncorhynchi]MCC9044143.1 RidA family protein [Myroides oncorhynchi]
MKSGQRVTRLNPTILSGPVGKYSHITIVPKEATIYTFSGQIGTDINGKIPTVFNEQVTNTFANITALLESQGLCDEDIIKVNVWATKEVDWDYFYKVWDTIFNLSDPSMTIGYITALGLPGIDIEIEVWAAK